MPTGKNSWAGAKIECTSGSMSSNAAITPRQYCRIFAGQNGFIQLSEPTHVLNRSSDDVAPYVGITNSARNTEKMKAIKDECILNRERSILKTSPEYQVRRRYENPWGTFSHRCLNIAYGGCIVVVFDFSMSSKISERIIPHWSRHCMCLKLATSAESNSITMPPKRCQRHAIRDWPSSC